MTNERVIESAQVVLPCAEPISTTINFFTGIGFRVRTIMPADRPRLAVLAGHGLTIRLEVGGLAAPGRLRLLCTDGDEREVVAPNGTVVEFVPAHPPMDLPPLKERFVVTHMAHVDADSSFGEGRSGMLYRDLIPDRLGGRFIASHILIPEGGPVGDYVHFHNIRFQMIYCYRGWVKVAYEDQGEPMLLTEGDCFLQPSTIRHRVLEASDRMQVIEIGCPAEHETWGDPEMALPTGEFLLERGYGPDGHRFVFHQAAVATWRPWRLAGYEHRDTGIGAAMDGLAGAHFPHTVTIDIRERKPVAAFQGGDDQFRVIDVQGRVLDVIPGQPIAYPLITGDNPDTARGQFAGAPYASAGQLVIALPPEVRSVLVSIGVDSGTGSLSLVLRSPDDDDPTDIDVRLGDDAGLDDKLARLLYQVRSGLDGVCSIDVSTAEVGVVPGC
jgi:quercetin dioxygenase-like cupin family protein